MTTPTTDFDGARAPYQFSDNGSVDVGRRGHVLQWHKRPDGEIKFSKGGGPDVSLGELKLNEQEELQVINQLLIHYRRGAIGCENKYYAASAGITTEGRLFIETNNMLHIRDKYYRGCAETPMLRQCQNTLKTTDVDFSAIYLMAAVADKQPDGSLKERQLGHVACPCGECRANLREHTRHAKFVMVPSNDGTTPLTLNKTADTSEELGQNQAWEISHEKMYPLPAHRTLDTKYNATIKAGYQYIIDKSTSALPPETFLSDITVPDHDETMTISVAMFKKLKKAYEHQDMSFAALNDHPTLENINRVMLQLMKKAYAVHAEDIPDDKNLEINVIILKTNKGEFFPGILVNGELWLPNKQQEASAALSNAYNRIGIAEIYMMTFNDRQLRGEISAWNGGGPKEGHSLKMPDPAILGRLIKNLKKTDNPSITVLPVNNGAVPETELRKMQVELNVREGFGPGYTNPKITNDRVHH